MASGTSYSLTTAQRAVYHRYAGLALPRHTSYPIAPVWGSGYGPEQLRFDLQQCRSAPLSVYVHVPFCESLCYYCACTKEIVPAEKRRQSDPADAFLAGLAREVEHLAGLVADRPVRQLHLGGGSPTFLTEEQLRTMWEVLARTFRRTTDAEIAIEIDPRITTRGQLQTLRGLGFNRVSLGVQDFDPDVQRAVNRWQPFETVAQTVAWCRELNFPSINFDLIYALPFQTTQSMEQTLAQTIALGPDRIAFYRLAVIPEMFRWQRTFSELDLPQGDLCLELNLLAINRFLEAGYEFIGLDHFARPDEELARARRRNSLHRNFQGMTTAKGLDLLGLGPSGITMLEAAYAQNRKNHADWLGALDQGLATERGLQLDADDRLRRELLQQLYGHGLVDIATLEKYFAIDFRSYFARELGDLRFLEQEGLVTLQDDTIALTTPLGRLLARVVAAVFDQYLPAGAYREGLPRHLSSKVG